MTKKRILLPLLVFLLAFVGSSFANKYPGIGVISCGDYWGTVVPSGISPNSYSTTPPSWARPFLYIYPQSFFTPVMYPAGAEMHLYWGGYVYMREGSTEEINPTSDAEGLDKHFTDIYNHVNLSAGEASSNGGDIGAAPWADGNRDQQIYTASFPTQNGLECRLRVRGFTLNTANLNNNIIYELQVTNSGNADFDCDGVVEMPNHRIDALTVELHNGAYGGVFSNTNNGGRSYSGGWAQSRLCGYDATPDADGSPWAIPVNYHTNIPPGNITADPATGANAWYDGERSIGFRKGWMFNWDIFDGLQFIGATSGRIEDGPNAPDKTTIFGTPSFGEGAQRGWFGSWTQGCDDLGGAHKNFLQGMGTFLLDGGNSQKAEAFNSAEPDPNVFDVSDPSKYTVGNPMTWVDIVKPEAEWGRPNGSQKYTMAWLQNWERNFAQTPEPRIPAEDEWTEGGTGRDYWNFGPKAISGMGPFSLEVGETMTFVWVQYAGHRLQGARQAVKTAREVYANNFEVPQAPPMPDMNVMSYQIPSGEFKNRIVWDNAAEAAEDFAGYKIYRVTAYPKVDQAVLGINLMDAQHMQNASHIGMTDQELHDAVALPNNPNANVDASRMRPFDGMASGPWKLQGYITKDQLATVANQGDDAGDWAYEWVDTSEEVKIGYTFYYYVAAFDNESGVLGGVAYDHLESGKDNWNGRQGEWQGVHYFAKGNTDYPTYSLSGQKAIGAKFVLQPARVDADKLISGEMKIGVKPNPYKVQAPHDVGLEHKVQFYNLTADTRITIMDLSGQIIEVIEYEGMNPAEGSVFWDMFSKDGPEVASGLYIWIAEYPGGSQQGYVAIQR